MNPGRPWRERRVVARLRTHFDVSDPTRSPGRVPEVRQHLPIAGEVPQQGP